MTPAKTDNGNDTLDERLDVEARITELSLSDDEDGGGDRNGANTIYGVPFPGKKPGKPQRKLQDLPPWLHPASFNLFHDDLETTTSAAQKKTLAECLPLLTGQPPQPLDLNSYGLPHLRRQKHAGFLRDTLGELPAGFVVVDASRPWLFYWALGGLSFLGEDVSDYRDRLIESLRPLQNLTGGFGGGHGQYSHCACTYASILALAAAGGLHMVDRRAMWHWLGTVKQSDGGFRMAVGAEEDIRGAYCAMTVLTLLNLPLDLPPDAPAREAGLTRFTDRLGEWVGRCQTYEGGIAGAPTNEAHGAYAFCALACLSILDAPWKSIPAYLDVPALIAWLGSMQTVPEGGFAGRTNKLVDACYSHWVGGCWALIQASLPPSPHHKPDHDSKEQTPDLWSREALVRYLLCCGQQQGKRGGMRDKPSCRPDGYHTCYSLAGLSAAQNRYIYSDENDLAHQQQQEEKASGRLTAAFKWHGERLSPQQMKELKCDEEDRVGFVHPVFVLPMSVVQGVRKQFARGGV